jgi:lipid-A-disaccharide synthase
MKPISQPSSIFLFAGEPSGDMHGGHLLRELKTIFPSTSFWGVGGPNMRQEGIQCVLKMEQFAVMGFSDVIRSFPTLWKQFFEIKKSILKKVPETVILIDYPGFNLRLARHLRKGGYRGKIVQYISPTVWAHGKKRINLMAKTLDLLITIFPFEANLFSQTSLKVCYVGNPLQEYIANYPYLSNCLTTKPLPPDHLIAIFPGSRKGEIQRNLSALLEASTLIKKKLPQAVFGISYADETIKLLISDFLKNTPLRINEDAFLIPKKHTYELMHQCRTAIAKSGTIALELALHKIPTVVVYKLSLFNWLIAKFWLRLKLPFYCITNVLANKEIFPEFIDKPFTPQSIYHAVESLHIDGACRQECLSNCDKIEQMLGSHPASRRAAQEIQGLFT